MELSPDGEFASAADPEPATDPAAELPPTGADVGGAALVAALLLALGAGALAAARRRTREV